MSGNNTKRPLPLRILFGLLTFVFILVFLVIEICTMLRIAVDNVPLSSEMLISPYKNVSLGEMKIGEFTNKLEIGKKVDDDATLSEYIYENIPKQYQGNTSVKDINTMLERAKPVEDFILENMGNYIDVAIGNEESANIDADRVVDLLKDYEDEMTEILGREVKESDYEKIKKTIEDSEITKYTKFKREDADEMMGSTLVEKLSESKETFYKIAIPAALVCLLILLLLHLNNKKKVVLYIAVCSVITAVTGYAATKFVNKMVDELGKKYSYLASLIDSIAGNLKNALISSAVIFGFAGLIATLCFIVLCIFWGKEKEGEYGQYV